MGGSVSVAENRTDQLGAYPGSLLASGYIPANSTVDVVMTEPFFLAPGYGIIVCPGTTNTYISASWQFYQESV